MKILNTNIISEYSKKQIDDINLLVELQITGQAISSMESILNEYENKQNTAHTLEELKNHVEKFGISEEILSLYGEDIAAMGIEPIHTKEVAMEKIDNILKNNNVEISQELTLIGIAIGVALSALILSISTRLIMFTKSLSKIQTKLDAKIKGVKGKKDFNGKENDKIDLYIPTPKIIEQLVLGCTEALKIITTINEQKLIDFNFDAHIKQLSNMGYAKIGNKFRVDESITMNEGVTLKQTGWDKADSVLLAKKIYGLKILTDKFPAVANSLNQIKDSKKELPKEEIAKTKENIKEFTRFMNLTLKAVRELTLIGLNVIAYMTN